MVDHGGHRDRLREEFLARGESFPDHKLLELILFYALPRQDTNPIAHELMERFGSLEGVLDAPPQALEKVKGVGKRSAVLLKAARELSRRYAAGRSGVGHMVLSTSTAYELLHPLFFGARNEMVYMICMDGKKKLLGCAKLAEGDVNSAEVLPRTLVEVALNHNAARVILAHNHVSGVAVPSVEDRATTRFLREVLGNVGVELEDHLVFVDDDMVSMRDSGLM